MATHAEIAAHARKPYADKLKEIATKLEELDAYYRSPKFFWPENDYAHVRTDVLPRLEALREIVFGPVMI